MTEQWAVWQEVGRLVRSQAQPLRVVVDTDLPAGAWYVVRGPSGTERRLMLADPSDEQQPCGSA